MSVIRLLLSNFRFAKVSFLSILIICFITVIIILSFISSDFKPKSLRPVSLDSHLSMTKEIVDLNKSHKSLKTSSEKFGLKSNNVIVEDNLTDDIKRTIDLFNKIILIKKKTTINTTSKSKTSPKKITYKLSTERLWFLRNGSLRPDPILSEKLAIWPNEGDLNDDRIVNQLMFVPLNYSEENTKLMTIYLDTKDSDWSLYYGRHDFSKCPVNTCEFVNKSVAPFADLIFFKDYFYDKDMDYEHSPNQLRLLFVIESPLNAQWLGSVTDHINWTATFRHDSEIATPYFKYFPYFDQNNNQININYSLGKTKKVAMIVSNCRAKNKRLEYAHELNMYIQVDIYGYCGNLSCPGDASDDCFSQLDRDYKFYLAFENSNCLDYITEKFWQNALMHNVIPIAMGAHPLTYKRLAPPNSYIHVEDFESPKHLANYLHLLDKNHELYNEYFRWKGKGEIRHIEMWCRICALLHAPKHYNVYKDLNNWWKNEKTCVDTSWTNQKLSSHFTTRDLYTKQAFNEHI